MDNATEVGYTPAFPVKKIAGTPRGFFTRRAHAPATEPAAHSGADPQPPCGSLFAPSTRCTIRRVYSPSQGRAARCCAGIA